MVDRSMAVRCLLFVIEVGGADDNENQKHTPCTQFAQKSFNSNDLSYMTKIVSLREPFSFPLFPKFC